ncbi:hypothetical protein B0J11DRAFT_501479 [Dendryphion nanum]|uniref:Uncharacterized protein n=1 Tax=Dendryphion nanum TaxID=256645 RepID=A0A9P9ELK9_9PLEO|nr:hypothetical protein B0J11DRAFT_501479 [Dendryphion nanum]
MFSNLVETVLIHAPVRYVVPFVLGKKAAMGSSVGKRREGNTRKQNLPKGSETFAKYCAANGLGNPTGDAHSDATEEEADHRSEGAQEIFDVVLATRSCVAQWVTVIENPFAVDLRPRVKAIKDSKTTTIELINGGFDIVITTYTAVFHQHRKIQSYLKYTQYTRDEGIEKINQRAKRENLPTTRLTICLLFGVYNSMSKRFRHSVYDEVQIMKTLFFQSFTMGYTKDPLNLSLVLDPVAYFLVPTPVDLMLSDDAGKFGAVVKWINTSLSSED